MCIAENWEIKFEVLTNRVACLNAAGNFAVTVTIRTIFGFSLIVFVKRMGNVECLNLSLLLLNSRHASIS